MTDTTVHNPVNTHLMKTPFQPPLKATATIYARLLKQNTHSPQELHTLMNELQTLRSELRARPKPFQYHAKTVVLSFYGFSNIQHRNNLLWALRFALNPTMLYSSEVRKNQWEGIMVLSLRHGTLLHYFPERTETYKCIENRKEVIKTYHVSNVDNFVHRLSFLMDKFKLSIDVNDLETWLDVRYCTHCHLSSNPIL